MISFDGYLMDRKNQIVITCISEIKYAPQHYGIFDAFIYEMAIWSNWLYLAYILLDKSYCLLKSGIYISNFKIETGIYFW